MIALHTIRDIPAANMTTHPCGMFPTELITVSLLFNPKGKTDRLYPIFCFLSYHVNTG